ncbi:MAG: cell envelope integrity protein TolA [Phycisphaerae bacterium]|jgi:hypothetical protein
MANTGAIKAGRAYVEVFLDKNPFVRGLRSCEKSLTSWGRSVSAMGRQVMMAGTAIVGSLVAASVKAGSIGHDLEEMSKKTGVGVEALSGLGYVARQSGGSLEGLGKSFRFMQKNLFAAQNGTKGVVKALAQLGLTVAELQKLTPEEQFKEIAGRIGSLADPTARAALAMKIFGRSGTELLPMFARGKDGINAMIGEAEKLGLIMSTDDAEAAAEFHEETKKLTDILKMGMFRVGSAIIPILKDLAVKYGQVVKACSDWVKANPGVVTMVLYLGAALMATGAAFMILGKAMVLAGAMLKIVLTLFAVIKTVLMFILSPLGLVVTALTAGVAAFLYFSGYGSQLLSWLGNCFMTLKDDATKAFNGIAQALAKGDIALAARILWLTLKMEFLKGKQVLLEVWLSFKSKFLEYWNGIGYSMVLIWDTAVYGIKTAWIELVALLKSVWTSFKSVYGSVVDWCVKKAMGAWIWWQKLMNPEFDDASAKKTLDDSLAQDKADRDAETQKDLQAIESQRASSRSAAKAGYEQDKDNIANAYTADIEANNKEAEDRLKKNAQELAKAKGQWQASLNRAAEPADAQMPQRPNIPKFGDTLAMAGSASAIGTFSASGLSMLGAGGVMQKIAAASQATADNTEEIADNTADSGDEFAE